jgi:DNA-binding protein YbaB
MFDGRDLNEAERLVDEWQAGIEERATRTRDLAERLRALTATARSEDDLVSVTIDSHGDISDLLLKAGVRDQPAAVTARAILATLRAARRSLAEAASAATDKTVGADSETGKAVIASYEMRKGAEDA